MQLLPKKAEGYTLNIIAPPSIIDIQKADYPTTVSQSANTSLLEINCANHRHPKTAYFRARKQTG